MMALTGFLSINVITKSTSDNVFVNKSIGGVKGVAHKQVQMGKKWSKIEFSGRWGEMAGQSGGDSLEWLSLHVYHSNIIR